VIEESQIASRVDFECRRRGAQQLGYPPVVATGVRTNTIHYVANNSRGVPGDLALMDAGLCYLLFFCWTISVFI
jgi:Xaa-Pro aminopeptidase